MARVVRLAPPQLMDALGPFDLDPHALKEPRPWPTANHHVDPVNGLQAEWATDGVKDMVWLYPDIGMKDLNIWMERMVKHENGIAFIPAMVETPLWFDHVWGKATSLMFLRGLVHHHDNKGKPVAGDGLPMALVAYGWVATKKLQASGLDGYFVQLPYMTMGSLVDAALDAGEEYEDDS